MDYILYNFTGDVIKRFQTEEEGVKAYDRLQRQWEESIGKRMDLKLCYNGFKSTLIRGL